MRIRQAMLAVYAAAAALTGITLTSAASAAEFTVLTLADSGEGSLRQAVLDANARPGTDTIRFVDALLGTIPLTSGQLSITDHLTIDGPGADRLAVSGNHQSRVVSVSGQATVAIAGLTIKEGRAVGAHNIGAAGGDGGGILNIGSTLSLKRAVLAKNQSVSTPRAVARGGAIANLSGAVLTVTECLFAENEALGGANAGPASGGGVFSEGSTAAISDSTFSGNQAIAGDGTGNTGLGRGAGLYNFRGTLIVENCAIVGNLARGGSNNTFRGTLGGPGAGAGVFNADGGILFLSGSTVTANQAVGGSSNVSTGGDADVGTAFGGGLNNIGTATVTDCWFENNEARGGNGNRGDGASFQFVGTATGGGIATSARNTSGTRASLTLENVTLRHNRAVGGDGNTAGTIVDVAIGGGLGNNGINPFVAVSAGSEVTLRNSTITHNQAVGGRGGSALGGGLANTLGGFVTVFGGTLRHNRAQGGGGATAADGGPGLGGGLYNGTVSNHRSNSGAPTVLTLDGTTIAVNKAEGGAAEVGGSSAGLAVGGGLWSGSTLTVRDSTVAHNAALGGDGTGGANGGDSLGGGVHVAAGTASIAATDIRGNRAIGGEDADGSEGGNGFGGGTFSEFSSELRLQASTITRNHANAGDGIDAEGIGGGVYALGLFEFDDFSEVRKNHASTSHDDLFTRLQ